MQHVVELDAGIAERARMAVERMLNPAARGNRTNA